MAHPRMYDDLNPLLKRLREICLALPEAFEKEAWGECTFRVTGGSMFAMTDCNHHNSGHIGVWVKAPPMVQEILVNSDAKRFFIPPYMGPKGWVGIRLDAKMNWDEVAGILKDGYQMSAPKRGGTRISSAQKEAASMSNVARKQRALSKKNLMPTVATTSKRTSRKSSGVGRNESR